MGSESIAHEAEGRMGYYLRGHEGERNNCFSKIRSVPGPPSGSHIRLSWAQLYTASQTSLNSVDRVGISVNFLAGLCDHATINTWTERFHRDTKLLCLAPPLFLYH